MNRVTNNSRMAAALAQQDRYGLKLAARLEEGSQSLEHNTAERLRAAREQALARRKRPLAVQQQAQASATVSNRDGSLSLGGGEHLGWWGRMAAGFALVVLVAGLVTIDHFQDEQRTQELAAVDADLLTDDVPPSAYADPGFLQFLKHGVPNQR
jgi:Protein of unknown function (DUF3619)